MDIAVTRTTSSIWSLVDLLGRPLGRIIEEPGRRFIIEPNERGKDTLADVVRGPHPSLEEALSAIEKHTHGTCQLTKGDEEDDR